VLALQPSFAILSIKEEGAKRWSKSILVWTIVPMRGARGVARQCSMWSKSVKSFHKAIPGVKKYLERLFSV
jgi:hypothetical protein